MSRYSYWFLLVIALATSGKTLAQDSLVRFSDLQFRSTLEKSTLSDHFLNRKTDMFMLLVASGVLLKDEAVRENRQQFYAHLDVLQTQKAQPKKSEKRAQFIYDDIHRTYLRKYQEVSPFEEIFYNGTYNCVSATALYALTFERLAIPYTIREKPTHVYLVANPGNETFKVETTSPVGSFQLMDAGFRQQFVKLIREQKLITEQEFQTENTNTLFERFYYRDQHAITLLNLIGLQYANDALLMLDAKKYDDALAQIQKAWLFYPCDRLTEVLLYTLSNAFHNHAKKDETHARYLAMLSRFRHLNITTDEILGEFEKVIQDLLFKDGQQQQLERYYTTLREGISDLALRKEIDFRYALETGKSLTDLAQFREALPFFEKAMVIKPDDRLAAHGFVSTLGSVFQSMGNNPAIMKSLEGYVLKYPALESNYQFLNMMAAAYLLQMSIEFDLGRAAEGEKYKTLVESLLKKNDRITINSALVAEAYSFAAVYYFRKGQNAKAKTIINKGLEIAPGNHELMARQRMMR